MQKSSRATSRWFLVVATSVAVLSSMMVFTPAEADKPGLNRRWSPRPAVVSVHNKHVAATCEFIPSGLGKGRLIVQAVTSAPAARNIVQVGCHLEGHYGPFGDEGMLWDKVNADAGVGAIGVGGARVNRGIQFFGEDITRVRRVCVRVSYAPGDTVYDRLRPGPTGAIELTCGDPVQQAWFPTSPGGPPV